MAQAGRPVGEPVHEGGQLVEGGRPGEQGVEPLVGRGPDRDLPPVGVVAAGRPVRADPADLARADREAAGVEVGAEADAHRVVAIPGQLHDLPLVAEQLQRPLQPRGRRGDVEDEVAVVGGLLRRHAHRAQPGRERPAPGVGVDELEPPQRHPSQQRGHAGADHAAADDGHPVAVERPAVPQRVDGGLQGAEQDGPPVRQVVGQRRERGDGHDIPVLVGVQAEHASPDPPRLAVLDDPDGEVAVLDRPRQLTHLERRPHPFRDGVGHAAAVHEQLGAAADRRQGRADQGLPRAGRGDLLGADLAAARRDRPVRPCLHARHCGRSSPAASRGRPR